MSLKILRSIFSLRVLFLRQAELVDTLVPQCTLLAPPICGFHFDDSEATVEIAATNDFRASSGARQKQPARGSHFKTDVLRLFVGLTRKSFSVPEPRIRLPRAAQASYRSRIASRVAMMRSDADRGPVRTNPRQSSVVSEPVGQHYVEKRRRWIARFACLPSAQLIDAFKVPAEGASFHLDQARRTAGLARPRFNTRKQQFGEYIASHATPVDEAPQQADDEPF